METNLEVEVQPDMDRKVGRTIHMLMWDHKITQRELAPKLGMQQSALSKKLKGERGWSINELFAVAAHLQVTVSYLIGETTKTPPTPDGDGGDSWCAPRDLNPEPIDSGSNVIPLFGAVAA